MCVSKPKISLGSISLFRNGYPRLSSSWLHGNRSWNAIEMVGSLPRAFTWLFRCSNSALGIPSVGITFRTQETPEMPKLLFVLGRLSLVNSYSINCAVAWLDSSDLFAIFWDDNCIVGLIARPTTQTTAFSTLSTGNLFSPKPALRMCDDAPEDRLSSLDCIFMIVRLHGRRSE